MEFAHDAEDWIYGAEGNETLVLRYTGKNQLYRGHVLRLRKREKCGLSSSLESKSQDSQFCIDFIRYVIGSLVGPEYVVPQSIINVSRAFLQAVSEKIEHDRPDSRRRREIDVDQNWAFLALDLTYGYSVAVEIKPKWGFLPSSSSIDPQHRIIKQSICRFCMHSVLKHNRTDFRYCPLDLFSGNSKRMEKALTALEHESTTHGTFKIFGKRQDTLGKQLMTVVKKVMLQEPLLARLQSLQRRLDMLDIEGIYPIYTKHQQEGTLPPVDTIQPWIDVVKKIQTGGSKSDWQLLYEFTLSMIFKDCSVFISITDLQQQQQQQEQESNKHGKGYPRTVRIKGENENIQVFSYDIKLVDVDLKKMSKIPFWYARDQSIVTHAIKKCRSKACEEFILSSN